MLKYHNISDEIKVAEVSVQDNILLTPQQITDLMAEAYFNSCDKIIINSSLLPVDFFNLKTRIAGEVLQKFSNFRMKLAIIGDFSAVTNSSLRDFIHESNPTGMITFAGSIEEAFK